MGGNAATPTEYRTTDQDQPPCWTMSYSLEREIYLVRASQTSIAPPAVAWLQRRAPLAAAGACESLGGSPAHRSAGGLPRSQGLRHSMPRTTVREGLTYKHQEYPLIARKKSKYRTLPKTWVKGRGREGGGVCSTPTATNKVVTRWDMKDAASVVLLGLHSAVSVSALASANCKGKHTTGWTLTWRLMRSAPQNSEKTRLSISQPNQNWCRN